MNKIYNSLYKYDTRGKLRVWFMEQDGHLYRTHSGLAGGKKAITGWTTAKTTNAGRANEREPVAQATFEIEAEYTYNLKREYHTTPEGALTGPHFFMPMLAQKYKTFSPGYAQPKLDGVRCIAKADGLWTREGEPILGADHILKDLASYFARHPLAILDGELYNHDYKDDFEKILSAVRKKKPTDAERALAEIVVQYHVYDMPSVALKFGERYKAYDQEVAYEIPSERIIAVPATYVPTEQAYDDLHWMWVEDGYEGSILREDDIYENTRSKYLKKRKEFIDEEFECVRIEAGNGNWAGVAKMAICRLPDGREFGAGIKGNRDRARALLFEEHKIVTVRYGKLTAAGIPKWGVVTKFWGERRDL